MAQKLNDADAKLGEEVLNFCFHALHPCEVVAACKRSDFSPILPVTKRVPQVLVIVRNYQPRLMNLAKVVDGNTLSILAVDTWVFERDVDRGFLGEALAGALVFPYVPFKNAEYLRLQEISLKKRLVIEILQSLVQDFPELSHELHIKPEYFMYEAMITRGRLFPPTLYAFANLTRTDAEQRKIRPVLDGFMEALKHLEQMGQIFQSNGYWRISKEFVDKARSLRLRFVDLFRTGQRTLFAASLGMFPQVLEALSQNPELLLKTQVSIDDLIVKDISEDPECYVYVPTANGLVALANRLDVKGFARKALGADRDARVKIEKVGGILNDVYLVEASAKGKNKKAIIKQYRDWSNFKWFPLTLWSLGTRTFAVAGNSRLERECAMNYFLNSKGFTVPKLLNVSSNQRLAAMEYVEGENLTKIVKSAVARNVAHAIDALNLVEKVGQTIARVHALDVALGDTKPENIFVSNKGEIYLMDLEQASRKGDVVWDIAEFLYYAGHEISPLVDITKLRVFAETFVKGYLKAGGEMAAVKSAGTAKYTKVFSIFTYPHIIFVFSNVCRTASRLKE